MFNLAKGYAGERRYKIHPTKTTLDKMINIIILQAKFYIYRSRGKQVQLHANNFMKEIRFLYDTEKVNAFKNNRTSFFHKSWEPYKGIITEDEI